MTKERIDLLYIGVREGADKPATHLWYDLTGIGNDGTALKDEPTRHHCYSRKRGGNVVFASPGQVFSFETSETGIFPTTSRYVGRWNCQDDVVRWSAESDAIKRSLELVQLAKQHARDRLDWQALEPFRQAYHGRLNYKQQQMLLAQIIQFVTKHKAE